jgi:hypothetical protein
VSSSDSKASGKKPSPAGAKVQLIENPAMRMRTLIFSGPGKTESELIERTQARLDAQVGAYEQVATEDAGAITAALALLLKATDDGKAPILAEIRQLAARLREESLLLDYSLVDVIAGSLCVWCDDHGDHPRLARAVRAHAAALQTIIQGKMRGERPAERAALMAGLTAELSALDKG